MSNASDKPLVILNPRSQNGQTGEQAGKLAEVISRYAGEIDTAHTEAPRHAVTLAEQAAEEGRPTVIAVGGDGTIHEVANGLMRARERGLQLPKLGIVGQGTGGDFRKTFELEHRLDSYCKVIAAGKTRSIDMGKFHYVNHQDEEKEAYFINILSAGLGGLVDQYVAESSGALGGTLAYLSASARALLRSEIGILDCVLHEGDSSREVELRTRMIAICNGRFFGSGMEVAPMAKPDDGIFHVVSLGAAARLKFMVNSLSIYSGSHIDHPDVEVHTCDKIEMTLRNDSIRDTFLLDVDGEPMGMLPITVEIVPSAIEVLVG